MKFKRISFIVFVISTLTWGCTNSSSPVANETHQPTVTLLPTFTPSLTSTSQPTLFPTVTTTFTPESTIVSGWFPIPKITHPETIDISAAQAFEGLKIPPLPAEIAIEFNSGMPYGEVPPETIFYQIYLIRMGDTRMLWLGIPFRDTVGCCGQDTPHRIYDSIPFPPIETDNLLIPFICTRNQEPDIFLIVVAEPPEKESASATNIRYAWRIDQEIISLQPVSTEGIECSPTW